MLFVLVGRLWLLVVACGRLKGILPSFAEREPSPQAGPLPMLTPGASPSAAGFRFALASACWYLAGSAITFHFHAREVRCYSTGRMWAECFT